MSETSVDAEKLFHHECDCGGTVRIPMRPEQYVILADDARCRRDDEEACAELRAEYEAWPGFETATGSCDRCGTRWIQGTATAVPRDQYADELAFHRPLTCPACHHRFTLSTQCYPSEDDVVDKQLVPYTAAEVQEAGEAFYSLYMTKGLDCQWNDHCEVETFYFKGRLGGN
ncbi:MAG: hypothetical protein R6V31_01615 [Halohasta sp.]